jgi:hypothetical protein
MKWAAIPIIFILLLSFLSPIVFAVENSIPPVQGQAVGQLSPPDSKSLSCAKRHT